MAENAKTIIAIGRQFGSGGHEIGTRLAEMLGIPFYDRELLSLAAQESGIDPALFEEVDENATNSMLYSLAMGTYTPPNGFSAFKEESITDRIFNQQCKTVRTLAEKGSCVMIGRCCDYILRDDPNCVKVFIHAPIEFREERIMRLHSLPRDKAKSLIKKTDKRRAAYYAYYTGWKWGMAETNQLSIDSTVLGIEGTTNLIKQFVELKENAAE